MSRVITLLTDFGAEDGYVASMKGVVLSIDPSATLIDITHQIKPQDIMARLGGLPARKVHCSVLGDKALRSALNDYFRRSKQDSRIIKQAARTIDKITGVTDHDIEEAVLEGAQTLEQVQEKTKVGVGNPAVLQEVEQLMDFYKEKYFG